VTRKYFRKIPIKPRLRRLLPAWLVATSWLSKRFLRFFGVSGDHGTISGCRDRRPQRNGHFYTLAGIAICTPAITSLCRLIRSGIG
jgi:hypothetical protein